MSIIVHFITYYLHALLFKISGIPYFLYDLDGLEAKKVPQKCPIFVVPDQMDDDVTNNDPLASSTTNEDAIRGTIRFPEEQVFNHQPYFRMLTHHATFVIWMTESSMVQLQNILAPYIFSKEWQGFWQEGAKIFFLK